jgi:phosphate transport system permease protein
VRRSRIGRAGPARLEGRRVANGVFLASVWVSGVVGILLPAGIVLYLLAHGERILDPSFLLDRPRGTPLGSTGGILPAIAGSFALVGIGLAIALPLAVGGALFLSEFSRSARLTHGARFVIESLAAIPSIVYGLFGYAFFVVLLRMGTSLAAGSLVLALVMLPIILITAQEAFDAVPRDYREAALALGVDRVEWIVRVLFPKAWTRILAGIVLAVGHAMGSAAPVLFTAAVFFSKGGIQLDQPVMTLPTHLYFLVSEAVSFPNAYGTAAVLVIGLFLFNAAAMALRHMSQE